MYLAIDVLNNLSMPTGRIKNETQVDWHFIMD